MNIIFNLRYLFRIQMSETAKEFFDRMERTFQCVDYTPPTSLELPLFEGDKSKYICVMPANRYLDLCGVRGFKKSNGNSYAEHICIMNPHLENDMMQAVKETYENIPYPEEESEEAWAKWYEAFFNNCETALLVLKNRGFTIAIY